MSGIRKKKLHLHINLGTIVFFCIVIYLMAYVISYLGKSKLAIYEVSESNIVDSIEGNGVILRKESLVKTDQAGYLNHYISDGSKVSKNGIVYMLDSTGEVQEYVQEELEKKTVIQTKGISQIFDELKVFSEGYSDHNFYLVYETQNDISQDLFSYTDAILTEKKEELKKKYGQDCYTEVTSPKEGLVAFSYDGLEDLTQKEVSEQTFQHRPKMKILSSKKKQKAGSPAYRLVEGQDWKVMIPLSKDHYEHLKKREEETQKIQVTFYKDNFTATAKYQCVKQGKEYYVVLSFDNYIQRYLDQRFLYVSLLLSETDGLKIPSSSLTEKKVYKIPVSYLNNGGNSGKKDQLNRLKTSSKKGQTLTQISVTVYKKNKKYAWVFADGLTNGNVISDINKEKTYTLKNTTSIQGVYMVNRGFTVFKQIQMLKRNEDYCIVSAKNSGIELYDRIILNSDTVKEGQVIY